MLQKNSKVLSIIIPVFNEVNFLYELFEQLKLHFNETNIEIIAVDDGSTDGSSKLLKKIKQKDDLKFYLKSLS